MDWISYMWLPHKEFEFPLWNPHCAMKFWACNPRVDSTAASRIDVQNNVNKPQKRKNLKWKFSVGL